MGSESFVSGTVVLDSPAAEHFRTLPSWEWFAESHTPRGTLRIELGGRWYRNIGRYLTADLAQAQEVGEVTGEVVVHCTHDSGGWEVAQYRGRECWHGKEECLRDPVAIRRSNVVKLELPQELGRLAGLEGMAFLVAEPQDHAFELVVKTAPFECSCEGWDHRNDRPLCQNAPLPGGERVALERRAQ